MDVQIVLCILNGVFLPSQQPLKTARGCELEMARLPVDRRIRKYRHKSRPNEATSLLSLPYEALLEIGIYLNLPCIEALSATCRRLHEVFAKTLHEDQTFARENLRDLTLTTDDFGYHDFLLQILKREINPNYVKRLNCSDACNGQPFHKGEEEIDVARYIGWTPEDIQLIGKAISRSSWLENIILPDELITKMLEGSEEAVLVLLIPMLKGLSLFLPPSRVSILPQVFARIARAQVVAEVENPEAWKRLPLRKLHTVFVADGDVLLCDTIQYISLPSVRRVFIAMIFYQYDDEILRADLRKLSAIPRSRASLVFMRSGDMWRDIAEMLANHFTGPCTIRQYLFEPVPTEAEENEVWVAYRLTGYSVPPKDPMWYFWDYCAISPDQKAEVTSTEVTRRANQNSDETDRRTIKFSLKYRNFHWEVAFPDRDNMKEYEDTIRQAGIVPSPQWLALARWDRGLCNPEELDDDKFALEE